MQHRRVIVECDEDRMLLASPWNGYTVFRRCRFRGSTKYGIVVDVPTDEVPAIEVWDDRGWWRPFTYRSPLSGIEFPIHAREDSFWHWSSKLGKHRTRFRRGDGAFYPSPLVPGVSKE